MRVLTLGKTGQGLGYAILGAFGMYVLLAAVDHVPRGSRPNSRCTEGEVGPVRPARLPLGEAERQVDAEKAEMMRLMRVLLLTLNRTLEKPSLPSPPRSESAALQPPREKSPEATALKRSLVKRDLKSFFKPVVTSEQKQALYTALLKLHQISKESNFTWMLYSGSLLGSFRHHDMVPWDDDFDVFMNYSQRQDIVVALSNLEPEFHLFEAGSRLKFWTSEGTAQASKYPWKWPYLDISFFKENATHVWDGSMEDDYGDRYYVYPRTSVFPLHPRPMGKYYFPAPRDSYANLRLTYRAGSLGTCSTAHYSHKNEALTEGVHRIMCKDLKDIYPFVHRTATENGVIETLKLNDISIHEIVVNEPKYAITRPYTIELVSQ